MQIRRLSLANFMSYASASISLENRGLVLVEGENRDMGGSNGAGKSALFESLLWVLYGKVSRNVRASKLSRDGAGETCVYAEIVLSDELFLKVYRYYKHSDYGNKLLVYVNDQNRTMGSNTETQNVLTALLQLDPPTFQSAVMFPQGSRGFASGTDSEQKSILDSVLGTSRFAKAQEVAKDEAKVLSERKDSFIAYCNATQERITSAAEDLAGLRKSEEGWISNREQKLTELTAQVESLQHSEPLIPQDKVEEVERLQKLVTSPANLELMRLKKTTLDRQKALVESRGVSRPPRCDI